MAAADFAKLSRIGAERFIQTVLVIDNELNLEPEQEEKVEVVVTPGASARNAAEATPAKAEPKNEGVVRPDKSTSALNAKKIMDAFLRQSMICGMHKPASGNDLVAEAIQAARRSDAVIIDWKLQDSDTGPAKEIIAGILDGDADEHGRLRLIVIYTDEPNIPGIQAEVLQRLENRNFANPLAGVISSSDTRIVVLNKEDTVGATDRVKEADLPERVIKEFAHLTDGILSTFAVTAVASIRRAVHHVLAIFSKDLDGAFLGGHISALQTPEDAREFALDLLAGELRSVASMNLETNEVLAPENLELYVVSRAKDGIFSAGGAHISAEIARKFPSGGEAEVKGSWNHQWILGADGKPVLGEDGKPATPEKGVHTGIVAANVGYIFHDDAKAAEAAHHRFARVASFRTEMFDRTTLPDGWSPTLMLGTVVVELTADSKPNPKGYLLCTQPRCDAVRLDAKKPRTFPFQTAEVANDPKFNLVAAVPKARGGSETVLLKLLMKPHESRMVDFQPAAGHDRIFATKEDASGVFIFTDTNKQKYAWIGDLRDLVAQRAASAVASRMHEVGFDEYEWLRLKAEKAKN